MTASRPARHPGGGGVPPVAGCEPAGLAMVVAAKDLLPGAYVWANGADPVRVLAVIPAAGVGVTVITESGGVFGSFSSAADDGYRIRPGEGSWVATSRLLMWIQRWHNYQRARCCGVDGPFCAASIAAACQQFRKDPTYRREPA